MSTVVQMAAQLVVKKAEKKEDPKAVLTVE